jgi:hypothetical protein
MQRNKLFRQVAGYMLGLAVVLSGCGGGSGSGSGTTTDSQPPVIASFTALPQTITSVQDVTLSWSVSGATGLSIDQGVGSVTGTSVSVHVSATTTYTLAAVNSSGTTTATVTVTLAPANTVKIAYLHHSTGGNIWNGGVPEFFTTYNGAHGTQYQITEIAYPDTGGGYPWDNYPYDYWNLWVNHTGTSQDQGELNLDQLAAMYDVIVFKHCFPVSAIGPDSDSNPPSVSSPIKTVANYQLQYNALKTRLHQFPGRKFIVWTGAALKKSETTLAQAQRARQFFDWVKNSWDTPGDNIFIWDFWALETAGSDDGGIYLNDAYAAGDSHPNATFSSTVAPYIGQRIVDVIEGRGDTASITGH